jgi:hypothetical protein
MLRLTTVKCVPYHNVMARHEVSDGGDVLHIFRVAANILNKQARGSRKEVVSQCYVGPLPSFVIAAMILGFRGKRKFFEQNS